MKILKLMFYGMKILKKNYNKIYGDALKLKIWIIGVSMKNWTQKS